MEVDKLDPVEEAKKLQRAFEELLAVISQSLGGVDLSNLKVRISWFFQSEGHITEDIQPILDDLMSQTTPQNVLNFLITRKFIGYLNYELLNTFQRSLNSEEMKAEIEKYETQHNTFLQSFTFNTIIEAFKQYPKLSPASDVGLPKLTINLDKTWEGKSSYAWEEFFQKHFTGPPHLSIASIERNCVVLIYAVLPFFTSSIVKDLEDPLLLKQLEIEGVSVELSSDLLKLGKQDYERSKGKQLKEEEFAEKKESPFKREIVNKYEVEVVRDTNNSHTYSVRMQYNYDPLPIHIMGTTNSNF